MLRVADHPLLLLRAFETRFDAAPLSEGSPPWLTALLSLDAPSGLERSEALRGAIRDLLRHGGYKPTGRGKPSSEYLLRAAQAGELGSINPCVDTCNAVSLHSCFPISVVDIERAKPPFAVAIAPAGTQYVFNASGQTIDLAGLLCLSDADGPCANAVKDAQRTKTHPGTRRTLTVLWGHRAFEAQLERALRFYSDLLSRLGAVTSTVATSFD